MRCLVPLLLAALPLQADVVADVRAALVRLPATTPIRATYELQRNETDEGKFANGKYGGKAAVEIEAEGSAFKLVVPRVMLEQIAKELDARAKDPNLPTPTERALNDISAVVASESVDGAPSLLRMLDEAKVLSDASGTWAGKPARVVVLRLADRMMKGPGKVTVGENKLTLWLGNDLVPLAAEHIRQLKFSFLVFKTDQKSKRSWHYARSGDRLLRARYESNETTSGMGQKGNDIVVATLKVQG
jgi:hypothetical protein